MENVHTNPEHIQIVPPTLVSYSTRYVSKDSGLDYEKRMFFEKNQCSRKETSKKKESRHPSVVGSMLHDTDAPKYRMHFYNDAFQPQRTKQFHEPSKLDQRNNDGRRIKGKMVYLLGIPATLILGTFAVYVVMMLSVRE